MPLPVRLPLLRALALVLSCAAALPAAATVFTANHLNVYRDGSSADWQLGNNRLLSDSFDNGDPYVGTAFTSTGQNATYSLQGLDPLADAALAVREQGGALLLDPNLGALSPNAQGQTGRSLRLRLLTNTTDADSGLTRSRSFAASLRLALTAMPDPGQSFGFRFSDNFSNNNDVIELFVTGGAAGRTVIFRKQDFVAGAVTVLGTGSVLAPAGAGMLVLSLSHATAGSDQVFGSYGYADASGALMGPLSGFANSATAFQGEQHTRLELRASTSVTAVPEPGAWALFAGGLGLLAARRLRRG